MTIEELYKLQRRSFIFKIKPYVRSYDTAEELVQDAFIKAISCHSQYNPKKGSLRGWFSKILFSCLWNHLRTLKKRPPIYDIDFVLESDLLAYEEEPNLREHISRVHNVQHKQALLAYFVLGNSYAEIAPVLGMTQDNVRKIVQRFREKEAT